jgi:hypothetical protein
LALARINALTAKPIAPAGLLIPSLMRDSDQGRDPSPAGFQLVDDATVSAFDCEQSI